jgi:hypothetical protein
VRWLLRRCMACTPTNNGAKLVLSIAMATSGTRKKKSKFVPGGKHQ